MGALLFALRDADRRASLATDDVAIVRAEGEAAIADARLEIQRLQNKMRALSGQRGLEMVYAVLEEEATRLARELRAARAQITALEERASSAEARAACRDIDREIGAAAAGARAVMNASSFAGVSEFTGRDVSLSTIRASPMRMNGRAVASTPGGGDGRTQLTAVDSSALGLDGLCLSSSSAAAKREVRRLSARIVR